MSGAARGAGRRVRRPGRGTLALIAGLLITSAVVRIGNEAGQAFAREAEVLETADAMLAAEQVCEAPQEVDEVLMVLREREARLDKRDLDIRKRMQALAVADTEIERRMTELVAAEEKLRGTLALANSAAEDDLVRLTAVYENMKPKQAAALFETMDPDFAAGFLGRMRAEAAAGVMAGLSPEAAYTISVVLAGRNAEVPRQ